MNLIAALNQEATKLEHKLSAVRTAIAALNGTGGKRVVQRARPMRTMSLEVRRRISRTMKAKFAAKNKARGGMSAATKKKLSIAAKARWAARAK
jgi:hypothetical protein